MRWKALAETYTMHSFVHRSESSIFRLKSLNILPIFATFAELKFYQISLDFGQNLPEIGGPGKMYGYPTVTRRGPRGLHFRGRQPIPRLPELASNCVRPAAALRDQSDNLCVDGDVADGKSSRPWAMHGQPPGRPPGRSTEYFPMVPAPVPCPFLI